MAAQGWPCCCCCCYLPNNLPFHVDESTLLHFLTCPNAAHYGYKDNLIYTCLNQGGCGIIYRITYALAPNGPSVIMKCNRPQRRRDSNRELEIAMQAAPHPNIVTTFSCAFDLNGRALLFMEYAPMGDLCDFLNSHLTTDGFSVGWMRSLFLQLVDALRFLHEELGVVHLDIKPENILLFDGGSRAKLCDFGFSRRLEELRGPNAPGKPVGTLAYVAPEILAYRPPRFSPASDIWALGCILLAILTRSLPFNSALPNGDSPTTKDVTQRIAKAQYLLPPDTPPELCALLKKMLHPDHKKRSSLRDLADHPWPDSGMQLSPRRKQ